jgi:ubiquinone/menaquinone biosynthesis C-methylase UbiE
MPNVLDVEFDRFADEYEEDHAASIRLSGERPDYFHRYKIVDLARTAAARGLAPRRILDFGAGVGNSVPFMRAAFPDAEITCIDPSRRSLDIAEQRFPGMADFVDFDGKAIPHPDASFDLVFTACVFHHIPEEMHVGLLGEIERVLTPGGSFLLYEHNPANPLTRHAVNTCAFDENAVLIGAKEMRRRVLAAGFASADIAFRVFFPRALAAFRPLEHMLWGVPLGAQYHIHAIRRAG